jgi:septum formation protein
MIQNKKIILASGSPRRQEILAQAGFKFEIIVRPTTEHFSENELLEKVPEILAKEKAEQFAEIGEDTIVISADTVVIANRIILNKPQNRQEAIEMLTLLQNNTHKVVTGVCIKNGDNYDVFSDTTEVRFSPISNAEIEYYVEAYKPFDKAGAYGVQEFIGMIGIDKIEGSFYTVMGLPIHKVYQKLKPFISI